MSHHRVVASGDTGAYGDSVEDRIPKHHPKRLDPAIPAGSPWITAVGGSQFVPAVPTQAIAALQANRSSLLGGTVIGEEMGVMVGAQDPGPWVIQGSSGGTHHLNSSGNRLFEIVSCFLTSFMSVDEKARSRLQEGEERSQTN